MPLYGEDELARLPILGFLGTKETVVNQLLRRIDNSHPDATLVHQSVTYAIAAPFTFVAGSSTAESSLIDRYGLRTVYLLSKPFEFGG